MRTLFLSLSTSLVIHFSILGLEGNAIFEFISCVIMDFL